MSSVLTASPSPLTASFTVGEWLAEPSLDRITCSGQATKLDPRSMAVLVYLAQQHNRVVSLRELDTQVWRDAIVAQSSIYQAITLLRRALGDTGQTRQYIETIPRKGYRLIAPVTWQTDASHSDGSLQLTSDRRVSDRRCVVSEGTSAEVPARRTAGFTSWRLQLVLAFAVGVCVLGACAMAVRPLLTRSSPPSLVVLPFADMTEGKTEQALGDGLAEEISNRLGQIPKLRVVARTSAFKFRDADVLIIGKELGVTHVLEGSLRRGSDGVRITIQLVNTTTRYQDWSMSFNPATTDVIRVQDEVARKVAAMLGVTVSKSMSKRLHARAIDPRAYLHYLDGKLQFARRTSEAYALASQQYQKALELEPNLAEAYVGLADIQLNQLRAKVVTLDVAASEIEEMLERALRLNDELPEAYLTRGTLRNEQARFKEAEIDLSRAIGLNGSMPDAYQRLGQIFERQGRSKEALEQLSMAVEIDPFSDHVHALQCLAHMGVGEYAAAVRACERARELNPRAVWPLYISAIVEEEGGRPDLALEYYRRMDEAEPSSVNALLMQAKLYSDLQMSEAADRAYTNARLRSQQATDAQIVPAELMVRSGELARFRDSSNHRELVLGDLPLTPDNLLAAAFHCLVVEDTACAEELILRAQRDPGYTLEVPNNWRVRRSGGANALFVAVLADVRGDTATRDRLLKPLQAQVETLERNGTAWSNLEYLRARIAALQGRRDEALHALRAAAVRGWRKSAFARVDPCLRSLRRDPEFDAVINEVDRENQRRAARIRNALSRS